MKGNPLCPSLSQKVFLFQKCFTSSWNNTNLLLLQPPGAGVSQAVTHPTQTCLLQVPCNALAPVRVESPSMSLIVLSPPCPLLCPLSKIKESSSAGRCSRSLVSLGPLQSLFHPYHAFVRVKGFAFRCFTAATCFSFSSLIPFS